GRIRVADISAYQFPTAVLSVTCSKGTYIRALARDLGEALGSGAFLSGLRRIRSGFFTEKEALTIEECLEILSV
ncbi:MAG: tRNA pseudouridine(55) synthase, partial [Bacteroidales bacterium]|nr:tRNA pseudouridine(55) synthase [Bacteroidales bacterium]